jgi:hypothetical protein
MQQYKTIAPTEKQREAHRILESNTIVIYGGAIRGGKSYWLLLELITFCFQYPKSRWIILRASYTNLERTILVSFRQMLAEGFEQYLKKWDGQSLTATWNNGSQLLFMAESYDSDKELNKFRGLEINGAGIDEVNEIEEVTFNKVIERSGSWNGVQCPPKILATCNPTLGWVKQRIYDKHKDGTLPSGWAYIPAKLTDNPYLSKEYITSLKENMPPYEFEVYVNGNWDVLQKTGQEFYFGFSFFTHCQDNVSYNPNLPLWLSFDENVNPYLSCVVGQIQGKQLFIIDEFTAKHPKNTVVGICEMIRSKYYSHINGVIITGDATSKKADVKVEKGFNFFRLIQKELEQFKPQLRLPSVNPSVYMRGQFINAVLSSNFAGINVVINKECKKTAEDFMQVKQAEDGTKHKETFKDEFGVTCQKYGHLSDGFDYLICELFKQDYNNYQNGGFRSKPIIGLKTYNKHTQY